MVIRLMGTGAAEGVPAFYSDSRVSQLARLNGGKEVRTRCGALIDGHLKIDLPPDTVCQLQRDGLDAKDWSAVFFTHGHDDHFALDELQYGLWPFNEEESLGFTIFGNETIIGQIEERYPEWPMDLQATRSFEQVAWGEYTVTPISARHMEDQDAHNLIIFDGQKTLLYATDTGVWADPTWAFLEAGIRLDGLVLECTAGRIEADYWGHHNLRSFLMVVSCLRDRGVLVQGSKVVSTHHSHNGDLTYAELAELLSPHDVVAGYDGYEFEI